MGITGNQTELAPKQVIVTIGLSNFPDEFKYIFTALEYRKRGIATFSFKRTPKL